MNNNNNNNGNNTNTTNMHIITSGENYHGEEMRRRQEHAAATTTTTTTTQRVPQDESALGMEVRQSLEAVRNGGMDVFYTSLVENLKQIVKAQAMVWIVHACMSRNERAKQAPLLTFFLLLLSLSLSLPECADDASFMHCRRFGTAPSFVCLLARFGNPLPLTALLLSPRVCVCVCVCLCTFVCSLLTYLGCSYS